MEQHLNYRVHVETWALPETTKQSNATINVVLKDLVITKLTHSDTAVVLVYPHPEQNQKTKKPPQLYY